MGSQIQPNSDCVPASKCLSSSEHLGVHRGAQAPAQSGVLSSKYLVSPSRRAAAPKKNDFTMKEGKTGKHFEKCPSYGLVQRQWSWELSCKNTDGRERWEKWVSETGRFTVLKCSLKRFTLLKLSAAAAAFLFLSPFFPNNLLLTLIIFYYHQPSGPSLDDLKDSDFGNTSWGSYEIALRCINLKTKTKPKVK